MTCDELRDAYELYALGVAEEPERGELAEHLGRRCETCTPGVLAARTLSAQFGAAALVGAPSPSPRLRRRILASVGVVERHYVWPVLWATAATLCLAAAVYFSGRERQFADESAELRRELGAQTARLAQLNEAMAILRAPDTTAVSFGTGKQQPPKGEVFVNPQRGVLLIASNLPPAPAHRIYEMWVIPKTGKPAPAGLFQSETDGSAVFVNRGVVDVAATGAVAVTLEDEAGAPQPTSQPLIVAPLATAPK